MIFYKMMINLYPEKLGVAEEKKMNTYIFYSTAHYLGPGLFWYVII
jgi:hypothetical protein